MNETFSGADCQITGCGSNSQVAAIVAMAMLSQSSGYAQSHAAEIASAVACSRNSVTGGSIGGR